MPVSLLPPHHLRPTGRVLGLGVFSSPSPPLLPALPCLLASYSPPPAGRGMCGRRACLPFAGVSAVCLRLSRVPFRSLARRSFAIASSLPRRCLSPCGSSPVACLAAAMSSRRASQPRLVIVLVPSCVAVLWLAFLPRACSSSVIRLMWLVVMFGCGFSCRSPLSLLACRCHPLGAGYISRYALRPALACRGAGRDVAAVASLVCDLLVWFSGSPLWRGVRIGLVAWVW